MAKKQNRKKLSRKCGRDKVKCAAYRARGTRERNKVRKLRKHCKKHPNDKAAWETKESLQ